MTNIIFNEKINGVLANLQHFAGTYGMYNETLQLLFDKVLFESDEMGLTNTQVGEIIRVLVMLKRDLKTLAGKDTDTVKAMMDSVSEALDASEEIEFEFVEDTPDDSTPDAEQASSSND